jgi:hypothetical protein
LYGLAAIVAKSAFEAAGDITFNFEQIMGKYKYTNDVRANI